MGEVCESVVDWNEGEAEVEVGDHGSEHESACVSETERHG